MRKVLGIVMDDGGERIVKRIGSIREVPAEAWNRLAVSDPATANPFVSHAFLKALEDAGTTGERAGWLPQHIVISDAAGTVEAVMPLYVKSHSQGEYVFDHGWADAFHRAGGRYYPKLQTAVPFTPVPGPRLLVGQSEDREQRERLLVGAALATAEEFDASSFHITFPTEAEWHHLGEMGLLRRTGQQFHWINAGYETFDDFLGSLASRKRKMVRKEREDVRASGFSIVAIQGAEISEAHWDAMYDFYVDTGSRKWGRPYLNRRFFSLLGEAMADRCLLVMAFDGKRPVAGALHLIGGDCLYGRYWGALGYVPCLHFELCYYRAIDYAIRHRLARVEAGAQGEHKLARGYVPVTTYSLHWFRDPRLAAGVARYLEEERRAVAAANAELAAFAPYKKLADAEQD
ncbi:MAG: GNAT family N-acetyltransferase [Hyphomicrobium sp.]|nr:GNAT family N-acetyltransferase [Hyphomicrobium sp.]